MMAALATSEFKIERKKKKKKNKKTAAVYNFFLTRVQPSLLEQKQP